MAERRAPSYCAVRSLAGKEVADEMFARHLPPGFDLDAPGDMALVESIVRDVAKGKTAFLSLPRS